MNTRQLCIPAVVVLLLAAAGELQAQTPLGTAFTYQGQLKDGGIPANGNYDLEFKLFDDPNEGTQVGSDFLVNDWPVSDGLFTVELDFGNDIFTGDALWLEVSVAPAGGDFATLSPRQPLNAAPYALYALDCQGGAGFWAASGDDIYNTNSGNLGIGTTTPIAMLEVANAEDQWAIYAAGPKGGVYGLKDATTGTFPGVHGATNSLSSDASGVRGVVNSTAPGSGSAGVRGINNSTSGFGVGVWGEQAGSGWGVYGGVPDGTGVYGAASGTSGTNYGVRGRTWSPNGYGVYGMSGAGTAVCGSASGTLGTNYGVRGETASPNGYAGYFTGGRNYFEGNVGIHTTTPDYYLDVANRAFINTTSADAGWIALNGPNGNRNVELTNLVGCPDNGWVSVHDPNGIEQAGMYVSLSGCGVVWGDTKSFRVPNPNQPGTEIWYACPEGPEAAAYVRGTGHLVKGRGQVTFPEHFVAVATAPGMTVQVTPLSAVSQGLAVVERSLEGFVVRELFSGTGTYDFDYMVMAVRQGHEEYRVIRDAMEALPAAPATEAGQRENKGAGAHES